MSFDISYGRRYVGIVSSARIKCRTEKLYELTYIPRKLKLSSQDGPASECCMHAVRDTKNELHQASA